ncbi:MFS transporter [Roseomonas marmotae]|uniref:MFS transporter n=1 Tax=Roseomonas marmotae TaxID=2768161 RepID=A0ABS3KAU2_9PROT|nr:MFS transporter [Roseomonas marmotae]MBO1074573.1 MFS transporter [Roseomonas marmotae]QTI81604.1 MFS transporter [Roseomonas marmotae]
MSGRSTVAAEPADQMTARRAVTAAVIGNVLEWYDFAVYGFVATILARRFFPSEDPTTALLATFAAFGVGFVVRPLGGIIIGRMGDTHGRKAALLLTIFMMAFGTVAIGLLPTYESIGMLAPILLVVCRLAQGFAAGGEWGGSTAFIVEWAPKNQRGFFGSFQQASVAGGLLLGSGIAALFSTLLAPEAMESWGWRIPFLLGGALIPLGVYMRRNIDETPAYREAVAEAETAPAAQAEGNWTLAARAFGFTILWTVSYYIMLNYMPTFTQQHAGLSRSEALWSNTIGLVVLVVTIPLMGALSDRWGRKPLLLACCLAFVVLTYPLFMLLLSGGGLGTVILIQIIFAVMIAAFSGPGPAAISEIFPTASRSTYMSTGYSLAVAVFGGFAPYIATWLIARTGSPISPTYYLIAAAILSTLVILRMRETAHADLK